ncbi:ABC transporter permease subunit [Frigoribacterium sp. CFBP 8754]|nr:MULTISPECIES: ABC transporter permease subunit [unclassified Frigoribacterium]MBD8661541.1 ABC transporter permease subunit [Frigoribacterium sp. CFBP 8754]MBD8729125.1 ABC transporter permease subunit [Frigoribacterium sp. CFBP 13707]QNE45290.1 ABC transporter permease subunit [Frigoribacterium sp. NBH87]
MVTVSFVLATLFGLLLGLVLYSTRRGALLENAAVSTALNAVINVVRPIPFIILIVAISPLTRAVIGTSIGTGAAIFALTIVATFSIARIAETNLVAVDRGAVEAGAAMGASPLRVLGTIVVPEALGPLTLGLTYIFVALVDATAVAGLVGGGGLGNLAITYGYQRFDTVVMVTVIVLIIVLVQAAQLLGNRVARRVLHA